MKTYTITDLEEATRLPRGRIYFYQRAGLLPAVQKISATRSVYTEDHVRVLNRISELRSEGEAISRIRDALRPLISAADASPVDLVARHNAETRSRIIEIAARLFSERGYRKTRVAEIQAAAGVSPAVFYRHFHSKRQLLIDATNDFLNTIDNAMAPLLPEAGDLVSTVLARHVAYRKVRDVSPDRLEAATLTADEEDPELRAVFWEARRKGLAPIVRELARVREERGGSPFPSDELVAHAAVGAVGFLRDYAEYHPSVNEEDVMLTSALILLAISEVHAGRLDVGVEARARSYLIQAFSYSQDKTS